VTLQFVQPRFGSAAGTDVSPEMLKAASVRLPSVPLTLSAPGQPLPYPDRTFDVTYTCCTMHHVPHDDLRQFVAEMVRVTRPGGLVFTFEHNPYNPLTRAVVRGCEMDRDAVLVPPPEARRLFSGAGLSDLHLRYYIFFPHRLNFLRCLERYLGGIPLGGQYFLAGRRKAGCCRS
jgi:SAM-dependent methyltransferase